MKYLILHYSVCFKKVQISKDLSLYIKNFSQLFYSAAYLLSFQRIIFGLIYIQKNNQQSNEKGQMGNSAQKQSLDAYVHPRLGPIKRIQYQQSEQFIEYCVGIQSQKIIQQWQADLKQLNQLGVQQYLFLPIDYSFDKKAMCGTGGNINIKYQDFMFSLAPEIINRRDIKRPFREEQIWYLLYNLAAVGNLMEKRDAKIGDIRPENILLNQDGQFKLISCYSWPCNPDNNQLIIEDPDAKVFLSPQECQFHNRKKGLAYPDGLEFSLCQVFSMGLTVLEAGTLKDCHEGLYERQNREWRFNQFKLRDYFAILHERYSKQLSVIIQQMLKTTPERRIKCSTIIEVLAPYKDRIINIQEFTIDRQSLYSAIENQNRIRNAALNIKRQKNSISTMVNNYYGQNIQGIFQQYTNQYTPQHNNNTFNGEKLNFQGHDAVKFDNQNSHQQRLSMKNQAQKSPRATTKMSMKNYTGSLNNGNSGNLYSRPFVNFNSKDVNNGMFLSFQQPQPNLPYHQFTPTTKTMYIPQNNQTNQFPTFNQHQFRSTFHKVNSFQQAQKYQNPNENRYPFNAQNNPYNFSTHNSFTNRTSENQAASQTASSNFAHQAA